MKNKIRKITGSVLSFALAASMVMGLSGMTALAAEDEATATEQTIIVKEQVDGTADTSFDYHIYQITEANTPIETMDDIISSVSGAGLTFTIYDTNTGEALGDETTDEDGTFSLSADEYAEFTVAAETDWYVFQDTPDEFPLISVTADGSCASVVDNTNGVVQHAHSEAEPSVDKDALQAEYNADSALNESDYTPASWAPFEEALEQAKAVLDNSDATQEQVDEALENLEKAKDGLEKSEPAQAVDKTALQEEYDADALLKESDYTPASWAPFEEALKNAQDVLKNEDATQEEVNEALTALQEAKAGLQEPEKVDKTALQTEYDADVTLKESDYTPESWAPFANALSQAKNVLDNDDATQEQVNEALENLQSAREALEKASEPTPEPGQPTVSVTVSSDLTGNTKTYDETGVTLTAKAEGSEGTTLTYQWSLYDEATGAFKAIDGATDASLNLAGNVSDSGMYQCTVAATDEEGNEATDSAAITITIEKAAQEISYAVTEVEKTVGDEPFTNALTVTSVSKEDGAGITYTSSDETLATVDPVTGEVTILAAGSVTITATAAGTADYEEATAAYTIKIAEVTHEHVWGAVTWTWNGDYTEATASRTCTVCGVTESVSTTDITHTTTATATKAGETTYTATATFEDGTEVTGTTTVETDAIDPNGSITVINGTDTFQITNAEIDAAIASAPEQTFTYTSKGNENTVTKQFVLISDLTGIKDFCSYTVTASDGYVTSGLPTDTYLYWRDDDECYRTAVNGGTGSQWSDDPVTIEVTQHVWGETVWTWTGIEGLSSAAPAEPAIDMPFQIWKGVEGFGIATLADGDVSVTATRTCTVCGKVETVTAVVTSKTIEPTETEPGETVYTATATFADGTVETDEKTVILPATGAVDKTALEKEYDEDILLIEEQYTETSWTAFEEAMEAAKDVIDDDDATQSDVSAALAALQTARAGLEEVTYPDITIVKYGNVVLTITDEDFKKLQSEAEEQTFTMNRNSGVSSEITAHFVLVTDLLGDCQPDEGCGVNFGTNWLDMDELYIYYSASSQQYSIAVDQAMGNSGGWTGNVTSITVGHAYANGVCTICGVDEPTVTVTIDSSLESQGNTKTYDGDGVSLTAAADVAFEEPYEVSCQWYKDDEAIEDATGSLYSVGPNVSDSGTYKCVVTATKDGLTIEGSSEITITINPIAQAISYAVDAIEKTTIDKPFTNPLTETTISTETGAGITYKSSDATIAAVDENGEVTILTAGEVTIMATAAATANYAEATASYTLTIAQHEHTWGETVWTWTKTESTTALPAYTATATRTCEVCGAEETATAVVTQETTATATEDGKTTYTATATFEGDTEPVTDTMTIDTAAIDPEGSITFVYGERTWSISNADLDAAIAAVPEEQTFTYGSGNSVTAKFVLLSDLTGITDFETYTVTTSDGDVFEGLPTNTYLYWRTDKACYRTAVDGGRGSQWCDGPVTIVMSTSHTHNWSVEWTWTGLPVYCTTTNPDFEPLSVLPIQPWNVVESLSIATLADDGVTATAKGTCTICEKTETVTADVASELKSDEPTEYIGALREYTATAEFSDGQTVTDTQKKLDSATGSIEVSYLRGDDVEEADPVAYSYITELIDQTEPFTIHYTASGGVDTYLTMPFVSIKEALGIGEDESVCCFYAYGNDDFDGIIPADGYLYQRNNEDRDGVGYYYRTAVGTNDVRPTVRSSQEFVSYVARIEVQCKHQWGTPDWDWSEDYSSATVTDACTRDNGKSPAMVVCDHSETVEAEISSVTTDPTDTKAGQTVYTATATFSDGTVMTSTKTVTIPATGGVDKTALQAEYDVDILITEEDYDADSWEPFEEALTAAKDVLDNDSATQTEVDDALDKLVEARRGLTLTSDGYVADYAWYTEAEEGTTEFTIATANQLVGLSEIVNGTAVDSDGTVIEEDTFEGETVLLWDDVKMNDEGAVSWENSKDPNDTVDDGTAATPDYDADDAYAFTPIGNMTFNLDGSPVPETYSFEGTFNGNGNTIENLYVTGKDGYLGLFGVVGGEKGSDGLGLLENFTITGVIECTGGSAGNEMDFVGAACAKLNAGATIQYVTNEALIFAPYTDNVGGIVGFAGTPAAMGGSENPTTNPSYNDNPSGYNTFVLCCANEATVLGYHKQGGIVGENAATVKYCYNSGWILARLTGSKASMGGIAGRNGNNNVAVEQSVIAYCYNTGTISNHGHNDDYSGDQRDYAGIAGSNFGGHGENELYNCYNIGFIPSGYRQYNCIASGLDDTPGSMYGVGALVSIRNNYSLDTLLAATSGVYEQEMGIGKSEAWFKGETSGGELDVWTCLGPYFVANDDETLNDGYPILWWQKAGEEEPSGTVVGLEVVNGPSKTTYSVNDRFDPNGMEVVATYSSGATELVLADYGEYEGYWYDRTQGFSISETEQTLSQSGTASIDIEYGGFELKDAVSVTVN